MRVLAAGLEQSLLNNITKSTRYIFDEAFDMDDSLNFLIFRNYDLILLYVTPKEYKLALRYLEKTVSKYQIPIMVLSTISSKTHEISLLRAGADDFITNDFDIDIIAARIDSKLRKTIDDKIEIDNLYINIKEEKIIFEGKELELKGKPFDILVYLAKHKNQVISKDKLLNAIWEEPEYITPNVVETSINAIRQKLDKSIGTKCIETVRRRGYKFCFVPKKTEETKEIEKK